MILWRLIGGRLVDLLELLDIGLVLIGLLRLEDLISLVDIHLGQYILRTVTLVPLRLQEKVV